MFTHEKEEKFEELKLSCHIDNMPSIEITEENVLKKLNGVKQINLLDRINCTRVLFEVRNEIVAPLTRLFKLSVDTATSYITIHMIGKLKRCVDKLSKSTYIYTLLLPPLPFS